MLFQCLFSQPIIIFLAVYSRSDMSCAFSRNSGKPSLQVSYEVILLHLSNTRKKFLTLMGIKPGTSRLSALNALQGSRGRRIVIDGSRVLIKPMHNSNWNPETQKCSNFFSYFWVELFCVLTHSSNLTQLKTGPSNSNILIFKLKYFELFLSLKWIKTH